MKKIYEAIDGRLFYDEKECLAYEEELNSLKKSISFWKKDNNGNLLNNISDDFWKFIDEEDYDGMYDFICDREANKIIFKSLKSLQWLINEFKKGYGCGINEIIELDSLSNDYAPDEEIIFYDLCLFPGLTEIVYQTVEDVPFYLDSKRISSEITNAKCQVIEWEDYFIKIS